jgi:GNAT superfamily N-acetyltransferase
MNRTNPQNLNMVLVERVGEFLDPFLKQLKDSAIQNEGDKIEVFGNTDGKPTNIFTLVSIQVHAEWKQIYIPKVFLPHFMRHQGVGKRLIKVIYDTAKEFNYELFIVQMVESFHAKMIKRGAAQCAVPDMIKITESTRLV